MFLIKECSYNSENPVYMKIPNEKKMMFIPEARVAKDYFNSGFYERHYIDWIIENNFIKSDSRNKDGKFFVELFDNCFMHYRGGGCNWMNQDYNILSDELKKSYNNHIEAVNRLLKII